ncbi:MAG TPA: hypothetical protein VN455_12915 [Methanotrichaceae archaeon]|nr:hypothetical protein [Methanotrichaceae archaeon]
MQENEQTADESEVASIKKGIIDEMGGNYYECMQALDRKFFDLGFGTPVKENYALMKDAIVKLQDEIRDSNDLEYTDEDYEEVTKELYEELLDEESGIDLRGRAVIDFVIIRLKVILEGFEVGDEWGPGRDTM